MDARAGTIPALVGLLALTLTGCVSPTPSAGTLPSVQPLPRGTQATVQRIVDGDTLVLSDGSRVRLTGIDTPESVAPDQPVECYGPEAADQLSQLLPRGTDVLLQDDRERFDRFDRRLAYVYRVDDGLFVNAALVARGAARVFTVRPNVLHREQLEDLQEQAKRSKSGQWGVCP